MDVRDFVAELGADFYAGVPDSQLKALCNYLHDTYKNDPVHHVIAANEGNAVALAAGYHLATGRTGVVYMQNSGEGNIINPTASLLDRKVYGIPAVFVVGWRGEPGVKDEPQHAFQGEITLKLLDCMKIPYLVVGPESTRADITDAMERFSPLLAEGRCVAFVIRKGALTYAGKPGYGNPYKMSREAVLEHIVAVTGDDPIICTTGKASRELFELRERLGQGHDRDFLTVGSMGHSSSIALGIALQRPDKTVWCIDGDGAALMHMGAMAVIGGAGPANLRHIVINNEAHETVGGMPTAAIRTDFPAIALACGYRNAMAAENFPELDQALDALRGGGELAFLEVKCALGSRGDLGRPTTSPQENKAAFMGRLRIKTVSLASV